MNITEQELKLQAYLDGELSAQESAEVVQLLEKDANARALLAELEWMATAMSGNELEVKLPESREFYWSKISREIEHAEKLQERATPARASWISRIFAPLAAAAAVVVGFFVLGTHPATQSMLTEVQSSLDNMGTMTFRDQSEGVTMVWVYDRSDEPFTETASADNVQAQ